MKTHPQKGYKIMSQIPAMREFLPGMYMHHEMINGQGYPQGLKGEEIPMQARIVSVADTFDAMTTERPYQAAMELEAALTRLKSFVGTRYDARVVAAFIAACEAGKIRPGVTRLKRNQSDYTNAIPQFPIAPTPTRFWQLADTVRSRPTGSRAGIPRAVVDREATTWALNLAQDELCSKSALPHGRASDTFVLVG